MKRVKKYKRNYLDVVTLRIDFDKIEDIKRYDSFLKKIDSDFPYKEKINTPQEIVNIDIEKEKISKDKHSVVMWDYLDTFKNKRMRLTNSFLAIEYLNRSYTNSKELKEDCKNIFNLFLKDLSITTINRLGLRYINRFNLDADVTKEIDWGTYFSKNLTGSISFINKTGHQLSRSMTDTYLKLDTTDMLIRSGIWNSDFPSENTKKEFILDIDEYSRFSFQTTGDIVEDVKKYNDDIEAIFEKSLGEDMRKILNKK